MATHQILGHGNSILDIQSFANGLETELAFFLLPLTLLPLSKAQFIPSACCPLQCCTAVYQLLGHGSSIQSLINDLEEELGT